MPPYFTSEHTYTANYCEENVYYLCRKFLALNESQLEDDAKAEITPPASEVYAVFITNEWSSLKEDGSWMAPPPPYPPISTDGNTMNLDEFLSVTENIDSERFGRVISEDDFIPFFSG
ncbi:11689_t:CDS:2 [Paraglomus brasilianum]|uniref:Protein N-terminal glutamine amidohydrolase n=1 Tax=Paraglomus brasilianum TaxID=144538 RepID=A0A9N8W0K5_9GLOM|nr:11689_t:CDS:2 [Paraglomus brasilianum]